MIECKNSVDPGFSVVRVKLGNIEGPAEAVRSWSGLFAETFNSHSYVEFFIKTWLLLFGG